MMDDMGFRDMKIVGQTYCSDCGNEKIGATKDCKLCQGAIALEDAVRSGEVVFGMAYSDLGVGNGVSDGLPIVARCCDLVEDDGAIACTAGGRIAAVAAIATSQCIWFGGGDSLEFVSPLELLAAVAKES